MVNKNDHIIVSTFLYDLMNHFHPKLIGLRVKGLFYKSIITIIIVSNYMIATPSFGQRSEKIIVIQYPINIMI